MRKIVLSTLIFLCIAAASADAQTALGSWSEFSYTNTSATMVFQPAPGMEGWSYCFNVFVGPSQISVLPTINGDFQPDTSCRLPVADSRYTVTINFNFTQNVDVRFSARRILFFNNFEFAGSAVGRVVVGPEDPPTEPGSAAENSPIRQPTRTDTTFLATGPGLLTGCQFGGSLRFTVAVDRVVGDVTANGTLVDAPTLIANGVVSQTTMLRVPAFDVDVAGGLPSPALPQADHVFVNGEFVGSLSGADNVWHDNKFSIPTALIRFGRRNPQNLPTPGINEIEILVDVANVAANGRASYCTRLHWAALSFDALAPTIMVHGTNSDPKFWDDLVVEGDRYGFGFVDAFRQLKVPFDNSIKLPTATVSENAFLLGFYVPAVAAEFGARHVHLVAHSKGGFDVRAFLAGNLPFNLGVLSLTTIATPHHGSVGADYSIDASQARSLFSDSTVRVWIAQKAPPDASYPDLRTSAAIKFNSENARLLPRSLSADGVVRPVEYMSVSADANLDHSFTLGLPTIQINETRGTGQNKAGYGDEKWAWIITQVYRVMGEVASTTLTTRDFLGRKIPVVTETPTTSFQLNDFLVTMNSARMNGFHEIGALEANHSTVANPVSGELVIQAIRRVQPLREPE
jgi:hypothetical protein